VIFPFPGAYSQVPILFCPILEAQMVSPCFTLLVSNEKIILPKTTINNQHRTSKTQKQVMNVYYYSDTRFLRLKIEGPQIGPCFFIENKFMSKHPWITLNFQLSRASAVSCRAAFPFFFGHKAFYLSGATHSYVIETAQFIRILRTDHTHKRAGRLVWK